MDRRRRIARDRETGASEEARQTRGPQIEFLRVVDEQLLDPVAGGGPLVQYAQRVGDQIAGVAGADLLEHPLVRAVDLGELALERALHGVIKPSRPCGV